MLGDPGSDQNPLSPFPHRAYRLIGETDITQVIDQITYIIINYDKGSGRKA